MAGRTCHVLTTKAQPRHNFNRAARIITATTNNATRRRERHTKQTAKPLLLPPRLRQRPPEQWLFHTRRARQPHPQPQPHPQRSSERTNINRIICSPKRQQHIPFLLCRQSQLCLALQQQQQKQKQQRRTLASHATTTTSHKAAATLPHTTAATTQGNTQTQTHTQTPLRVAIVGAGPSGFYTAKYLLQQQQEQPQQEQKPTTTSAAAGAAAAENSHSDTHTDHTNHRRNKTKEAQPKLQQQTLQRRLRIDIFDALPTPFGLVRSGVAPDHPDVKAVQHDFEQVLANPAVRFLGNVRVSGSDDTQEQQLKTPKKQTQKTKSTNQGTQVQQQQQQLLQQQHKSIALTELKRLYHAVVLCYGAAASAPLGIQGEDTLDGVLPARDFVNWYNAHPDFADQEMQQRMAARLQRAQHVIIVGHGNVAVDCARILARPLSDLESTDIADHAVQALRRSEECGVQRRVISVVGRRGPAQAAMTIKELRELTKLNRVKSIIDADEFQRGMTPSSRTEVKTVRPLKRKVALMEKMCVPADTADTLCRKEQCGNPQDGGDRAVISIRFLLSPLRILPRYDDPSRVGAVSFVRNALQGDAGRQRAVPITEGELSEEVVLPADLVLVSVGYRSMAMPGVPFDTKRHVVPNSQGRVADNPRLYVSGWLKRGPSGIIGTNIADARETVTSIHSDWQEGLLSRCGGDESTGGGLVDGGDGIASAGGEVPGSDNEEVWERRIDEALDAAGISPVTRAGWERIDRMERKRGECAGKPREKMTSWEEMAEYCSCLINFP